LDEVEAPMRSRLAVVSSLLIAGWIAACGGSDGSAVDAIPTDDAGNDGTTTMTPEGAAGDAVAADAAKPIPTTCDPTTAAACGTRKCDVDLGCVQCTSDPDCPATDPFCIRGRCEACRTNADCGAAAPACSPVDNRCHLSCTGDAAVACQPGKGAPLCDQTTGACVGCLTAANCPATAPLCESTTKTCVQCTTNTDCPAARPRCFLGDFTCVECATSADCTGGKVCDPRERRCVLLCTSDTQCGGNTPKCDVASGACVQCLAKADCTGTPTTPVCDTSRDRCVQCVVPADCPVDAGTPFCVDDRCAQCKDTKDCPVGQQCNNGACRP
jgi:Cys-rich repeat protein